MSAVGYLVDRQHVSTSGRRLVRILYDKLSRQDKGRDKATERKKLYREALQRHAHNKDLYRKVMTGSF